MSLVTLSAGIISGTGSGGGGGLPIDINSLKHLWRTLTITDGVDGNDYAVWEDLVGSADTSSSTPPKYVANSGAPYLEFDGSNDELTTTVAAMNDCTYWMVVEVVSTPIDYARLLEDGVMSLFALGSSNNLGFYIGGDGAVITLPTRPTGFMAVFCKRSGSTDTIRINGSQVVATSKPLSATGTTLRIGAYTSAGYNSNIRVKELGICDSALTGTDFTTLETWILTEYGLTL